MGKRNKERRAAKRRADQRRAHRHHAWCNADRSQRGAPPTIEELVRAVATLTAQGDPRAEEAAAVLADSMRAPGAARRASAVLGPELDNAVDGCWRRGWQPANLVHAVGHLL